MYVRIQSTVLTTVAAAGVAALVAAPVAPPPELPAPPLVNAQVRLTAAPPLGAIPLAFLRNQAQYCSVICPFVVQGAITVPLAAALTPVTFLDALGTTGSLARAIGTSAASVTGAANDAAQGIIINDVDRVVPKAFNNLEVAVVQLLRVGSAVLTPADFPEAVSTARETILAALNQPLPGPGVPVPTETGAVTLPEVVAVEAIKVSAAVAFQAGELLLLGVVQTVDAGAQELARSGDPVAAVAAAARQAIDVVNVASGIVTDSLDTAVTNIDAALKDPFPAARQQADTSKTASSVARSTDSSTAPVSRDVTEKVEPATIEPAPATPAAAGSGTAKPATKPAKTAKAENRPLRKVVHEVRRAVRSVAGSLSESPRKSLQPKSSEPSHEDGPGSGKHTK